MPVSFSVAQDLALSVGEPVVCAVAVELVRHRDVALRRHPHPHAAVALARRRRCLHAGRQWAVVRALRGEQPQQPRQRLQLVPWRPVGEGELPLYSATVRGATSGDGEHSNDDAQCER